MSNIPETEQWKLNGDCDKCRRKNYCTKKCRAKQTKIERVLEEYSKSIIDSVLPEPYASNAKNWL